MSAYTIAQRHNVDGKEEVHDVCACVGVEAGHDDSDHANGGGRVVGKRRRQPQLHAEWRRNHRKPHEDEDDGCAEDTGSRMLLLRRPPPLSPGSCWALAVVT